MYIYKCKIVRVVDGDTAILDIDLGFFTTIRRSCRLLKYNAPEIFGTKKTDPEFEKGIECKEKLEELLGIITTLPQLDNKPKQFICRSELDRNDKYGRVLVEITEVGSSSSVNDDMIYFIENELRKE
jgi:endonuclease YncB( thermonuclease family)